MVGMDGMDPNSVPSKKGVDSVDYDFCVGTFAIACHACHHLHLSRAKVMNQTALFCAARQGHAETIKFLLSKGADPNVVDTNGETALLGCQ